MSDSAGAIPEPGQSSEPRAGEDAAARAQELATRPVTVVKKTVPAAANEPADQKPVTGAVPVKKPAADGPVTENPAARKPPAKKPSAKKPAGLGPIPPPPAPPALRVRGLVKRFGEVTAVGGIDFTVPTGSFYGIVGPNGAGKTTTLSIISGFLRADAGTIEVVGVDQAKDPRAAKRVMGILPDRLRTFDRLTARQLLRYYGLLRGLRPEVIDQRARDLARAFDLTGSLGRVVSDFSAGMTKKLMLAGALIHSPRLLVLDEPFESVDPVSSGVILDILRAYVEHGGTVILSSHGMDLVERVCSRIAVLVGGELLAEGTVEEISAGQSLEARFVELAGSASQIEGLEWLHTFSD